MLSSKDKRGIWVIAGVVAALFAILGVKATLDSKPKPGPDNCVGHVEANTVVVLDHSERITEQTREEIAARAIAYIHDNVKVNERVSVFTVSELSKKSLKPIVSLCKLPDDGNRAVENVQLIRKRFQQNFEKPIREVLSASPSESKESPIAQALTDISLSQYLRGTSNTLLVFSDMLEHTPKFSLYKCTEPESVIARYRNAVSGAKERPEFKNTNVSLNLIPRMDLTKGTLKCRDKLWTWFFGDNAGQHAGVTFDYLPGGAPVSQTHPGLKK